MTVTKPIEELQLDVELARIDYASAKEALRVTYFKYSDARKQILVNNAPSDSADNLLNQCHMLEGDVIMAGLKLHKANQDLERVERKTDL